MTRRLRQHNGELVGGARATHSGRPWMVMTTVTGFHDARQALQFEWAWKHMYRRDHGGAGMELRQRHLARLMQKERWTSRAPLASSVALHVNTHVI